MDARMQIELAGVIRANMNEISQRLEQKYVQEYPQSRANLMDAQMIHGWTLTDIETLCKALETDDSGQISYADTFGDMYREPFDNEASSFINFIGSELFKARHLAPVVFQALYSDPKHANDLLACLERFLQRVIQENLVQFSKEIGERRSLTKRWNVFFNEETRVDFPDTPAKRHRLQPEVEFAESTRSLPGSYHELSRREKAILNHMMTGKTNGEIAALLDISRNTVKNHVSHIFDKFNVNSRGELMARFISDLPHYNE